MYRNSCTDPGCLASTHVTRCVGTAIQFMIQVLEQRLGNKEKKEGP